MHWLEPVPTAKPVSFLRHKRLRAVQAGEYAAHMPAALAAATPVGASSKTRHCSGGGAGGAKRAAAARKMSGAGLPLATWSPGHVG